ncbi:MAG: hypothetical protein A2X11_03355 [Bacteroidetes bacterium GWE2_42_24]|nr:MAG: hypothetical protein A2X11_03355 [Bacteroidetes bacterium GWE2_42_24]OFY32739.1 MAG: hypothetical protein A2X09_06770 [Bacteroidetes bacterium GWF2_43_11]
MSAFVVTGSHSSAFSQTLLPITVTHYDLTLDVRNFASKILYGKAVLTLKSREDNVQLVQLNLLNMSVDSAKTNGQLVSVERSGDTIRIQLPEPLFLNGWGEVTLWYHGTPAIEPYNWGGFHFDNGLAYNLGIAFEANPHNYGRAMFPCIDEFHERATYVYHITTDTNMVAVCGGIHLSTDTNPDFTLTHHWSMMQSIPAYLASVAVSKYLPRNDTFNGAERNIPIGLYFKASDSTKVKNLFVNLKGVLSGFEEAWGPYPFDRVGFCGTNQGAMEHAANVAYPVGSMGAENEWLWAHELSHMWFGDMVTCINAEEMWLNEGWAVFNEYLTQEILYGDEAYIEYMKLKHRDVISQCHLIDDGYRALVGIPNEYTYGETVYQKGGLVVHALRSYLGDEVFFPAIRTWLQNKKFQHASSAELRDFLTQYTGTDMTGFFDSWVFNAGFPAFVIDSLQIIPDGNAYGVKGFIHQKLRNAPGFFTQNRLPVALYDSLGRRIALVSVEVNGEYASFEATLVSKPCWTVVDPDIRIPGAMTVDQHLIKGTGNTDFSGTYFRLITNTNPDSAVVHVTHYRVAPDSLKVPVDGLVLSDFRFWQVKGYFPPSFDATGRFSYSKTLHLDDSLLVSATDSLMILYRPDAGHDWQMIPATKQGTSFAGNIMVSNLKPGDYTLAIKKFGTGIDTPHPSETGRLRIYPNPSHGIVVIETGGQQGVAEIFTLGGERIFSQRTTSGDATIRWQASVQGNYLVKFTSDNSGLFLVEKVMVVR